MLREFLVSGAETIGIHLDQYHLEKFDSYLDLLMEWNNKFNLTAIKDPEEIVSKHFLDSLLLAPYLKGQEIIADVGTGAGFPGLPLKILFPDLKLTLIDSLAKRVKFLETVVDTLQLQGVTTVHGRAEDVGKKQEFREAFDVVVARAVARMSVLCEYCLPLVKVSGRFIAAKGPKAKEELAQAEPAFELLGGCLETFAVTTLPGKDDERAIVVIEKIKKTPAGYPRKAGIPEKKPLEVR